jgi:hypothetical protein
LGDGTRRDTEAFHLSPNFNSALEKGSFEKDGKRITTRTAVAGQVGSVFQAAGIALPPNLHGYDISVSGLPAHVRRKGGKSIAWSRWNRVSEYLRMGLTRRRPVRRQPSFGTSCALTAISACVRNTSDR